MTPIRRPWRAAPLFVQVLAFLLTAVVAAQVLTAAVLVFLPPPAPEVLRLADVAAGLKSGQSNGRFVVTVKDEPPAGEEFGSRMPTPFGTRSPGLQLAGLLDVEPERVRITTTRRRSIFEPLIRIRVGTPAPNVPAGAPALPPGLPVGAGGGALAPGPSGAGVPNLPPLAATVAPAAGGAAPSPPPQMAWPVAGQGGFPEGFLMGEGRAAYRRPDGRWVVLEARRSAASELWRQRLVIWLAACALLFVPLSFLLARVLTRPIAAFAQAAERLGRDPRAAALRLDGPAEVRVAVNAFNEMQERLRRYIDDRTAMMGAVAHDMRTPLTRMRFLLEARSEDARDKMEREIDEMDAMVAATLAFVKDASTTGQRVVLDLGALVESLVSDLAETGAKVSCAPCERLLVRGDPLALRRLFSNLLTNAVKFAGSAEVSARRERGEAVVEIADRGPGLPEEALERAFEPFFRAEASRNRETGGIGLGLAVVRSVSRAHGGDTLLRNRPGGGLIGTVRIPAEPEAG